VLSGLDLTLQAGPRSASLTPGLQSPVAWTRLLILSVL